MIQSYGSNVGLEAMGLDWNPALNEAQRYTVRQQIKGTKEWAEANHVEEAKDWTERFDPKKGYWERNDPVSNSWDDTRKPGDTFTGSKDEARKHIWYPTTPKNKVKTDNDEHNQPMYQTSFTALTSLWEQMNKYVTENPGLEVVASWLEKIFNKLPGSGNGEAPQPKPAGAVGP